MNAIFLPPSLEEIFEQERINKEMEDKLNKVIEEGIEELLKPLEEPLKEAFNTVKIFGKRFRMVEGKNCNECAFFDSQHQDCGVRWLNIIPCGYENFYYKEIKDK